MKKTFQRFSTIKDRFAKGASDVTHRAVSHSEPVDSPVADGDSAVFGSVSDVVSDEKVFSRIFWVTGAIVLGVVRFVQHSFSLILLVVVAYLLSVGLEGPIRFFQKLFKGRGVAIFLCYLLLVLLCLSMFMVVPFVAQQLAELIQTLIAFVNGIIRDVNQLGLQGFVESLGWLPWGIKNFLLNLANDPANATQVSSLLTQVTETINAYVSSNLATDSFGVLTKIFGSSFKVGWQLSLVLVLSVFFSIEYKDVFVYLVKLAPSDRRPYYYKKMITIYDKLQLWLKGQLFLMVYIFVVTLIGLQILRLFGFDIPQIWLLALIAGVTEFIPYIGPLLGGLPAVLVAFTSGGGVAGLLVMALFGFIQWTENNIVVPVVMNKVLGVRSIIIFLIMLFAGTAFGFIGVVLAIPLSVIVTVFWGGENSDK